MLISSCTGLSPAKQAQWPPRSPHEALASTPGGRERLRRMAERASPSPSPLKKSRSLTTLNARYGSYDDDDDDVEDEEEDEETLQLKLQAIEAKLRLKALQKKQRKAAGGSSDVESGSATGRPGSTVPGVLAASRAQSRAVILAEGPKLRLQSQVEVQVPASPVRKAQVLTEQRSPSRVLLGIDKGLRAKDVSLKRASSLRKPSETRDAQTGGYLRRTHTPALGSQSASSSFEQDRPKSFSERLAAARSDEISRKDKQERIQKVRSQAFEVGQEEVERYKENAKEIPSIPTQAESFDREDILAGHGIRRRREGVAQDVEANSSAEFGSALTHRKKVAPSEVPEDEAASFEPYSGTHLSKRILPHNLLTRTFSTRKTILIKDLLAQVKAPDFQLPEVEQDIVVLGIVATKSEPKTHKALPGTELREKKSRFAEEEHRGKYMVLNLVDLTWQIELFLFNTAFSRYWKLTPGTLVAILNPTIMPPPKGREATNKFSLVLNSDGDAVLEIGTARDLGFCKSVKKDGELCNSWVNQKRTEFCEFHMNLALEKHRLQRQDVNAFGGGIGANNKKHLREKYSRNRKDEDDRKRGGYDRGTHSHFFVSQASAATLLDGDQMLPGQVAERVERGDALRRRLASQEKEREIMKQLGSTGRGAGKEYMNLTRAKLGSSAASADTTDNGSDLAIDGPPTPLDAKSLGIGKAPGTKMHLSPIKRKRENSAASRIGGSMSSSAPKSLGWGGSLSDKLSKMKNGERFDGKVKDSTRDTSSARNGDSKTTEQPARKKTRFVTEKGIREAGRESLGTELGKGLPMVGLDSDDELEILM
ncbi:primase zinc finger [Seiridium cupressi]